MAVIMSGKEAKSNLHWLFFQLRCMPLGQKLVTGLGEPSSPAAAGGVR